MNSLANFPVASSWRGDGGTTREGEREREREREKEMRLWWIAHYSSQWIITLMEFVFKASRVVSNALTASAILKRWVISGRALIFPEAISSSAVGYLHEVWKVMDRAQMLHGTHVHSSQHQKEHTLQSNGETGRRACPPATLSYFLFLSSPEDHFSLTHSLSFSLSLSLSLSLSRSPFSFSEKHGQRAQCWPGSSDAYALQ